MHFLLIAKAKALTYNLFTGIDLLACRTESLVSFLLTRADLYIRIRAHRAPLRHGSTAPRPPLSLSTILRLRPPPSASSCS